jgi:hypothetical protein
MFFVWLLAIGCWLLAFGFWLIGIATYFLVENASFCLFAGRVRNHF